MKLGRRQASGGTCHCGGSRTIRLRSNRNVQTRTIQNRIKDPGSMQLRDLWDLAEILNAPVGELAGGDLPEEMLAKLIQMKL